MARISAIDKQTTRERLLAAAARHFAEFGWAGALVDRISVEAGYAKGTLYNYFATKEELFAAVIEAAARRAAERYRDRPRGGTLRDRLLALARADVDVLREDEDFTKVLVREAMSFRPETYPLIVEHLSSYLVAIAEELGEAAANGELRNDLPPPRLALIFVGLLSLLYVQHWGSAGAWPTLDEIPALVVTLFLDGTAAREAS
ncbi:MAG: TetR/AcrR family transcriptional regulator [Acidobacteriota bacterium]